MPPGEIHLKALDPFNCSFNAGIAPGMRRVPLSSLFTSNMANPNGCPANFQLSTNCTDVYIIKVQ